MVRNEETREFKRGSLENERSKLELDASLNSGSQWSPRSVLTEDRCNGFRVTTLGASVL